MSHPSLESSRAELGPPFLDLSSPEALAQRLARVSTEDRVRGYVFQATLEQVRLRGSDEAMFRSLMAGGVAEPVSFFKYPIAPLLRMMYQATWELMGRSSFEATLCNLGRHGCEYFLRNTVGKSFLMMAGNHPRQLVEAMPVGYRTGWDHGRVSLQWMGLRHCRAILHESLIPYPYFEGVIHQAFAAVGVAHPRVRPLPLSLCETEFDLSWD